jgi:hypothetical protein
MDHEKIGKKSKINKKKIDRRPCRKYRSCWKLTYKTIVAQTSPD